MGTRGGILETPHESGAPDALRHNKGWRTGVGVTAPHIRVFFTELREAAGRCLEGVTRPPVTHALEDVQAWEEARHVQAGKDHFLALKRLE